MMHNLSILESIATVPKDRVAFILESSSVTYGDIYKLYERNLDTILSLRSSSVVINGRSRAEFSKLLSILDGTVGRILFLPKDIDSSLVEQYYQETDANYEVSIQGDELLIQEIKPFEVLESDDDLPTEWIIPTSGTTKTPKLVVHTLESLTRSTIQDIEKGKEYTWGLVFDIYRFSGIQVFLQALIGGSTLIIPEHDDGLSKTLRLFADNGCNVISATPSFWRKALMTKEVSNLKLKRVTLGGEISDEHILKALKNGFEGVKITHIYASTEVGVGFSVMDGKAGFPKSYLDSGDEIQLLIRDSLLWINPNSKTQKYLSKEKMFDEKGFINTGDLVEIREDRVYFLGRESGAINVGGNKVQPEEVEANLLDSGLVHSAFVYAKKNPMMGALVSADVVPVDGDMDKKLLKKEILAHCKKHLEAFKVPALLKIVDELSITQSGKLKRS